MLQGESAQNHLEEFLESPYQPYNPNIAKMQPQDHYLNFILMPVEATQSPEWIPKKYACKQGTLNAAMGAWRTSGQWQQSGTWLAVFGFRAGV